MKEITIFLLSCFLIFCIVTYFVGENLSHHLFLVYFLLSFSFLFSRKSSTFVKFALPCLFLLLWIMYDAMTIANPIQK